jgi:hypothetical protein
VEYLSGPLRTDGCAQVHWVMCVAGGYFFETPDFSEDLGWEVWGVNWVRVSSRAGVDNENALQTVGSR